MSTPSRTASLVFSTLVGLAAVAATCYSLWPKSQPDLESLQQATVISGSMAPTLLGPHLLVLCGDCNAEFPVSSEQLVDASRLVCPLCGYASTIESEMQPGALVTVDREAFASREPDRWQLIGFKRSLNGRIQWEVKRLVGLPGEEMTIREGDLFADGERLQKSLEEAQRFAILVHDSEYESQDVDVPVRWRKEALSDGSRRWTYHHWRCMETPLPRDDPAPVMDAYGVNASLSRELHVVRDLIFESQLSLPADAKATARLETAGCVVEGVWTPSTRQTEIWLNGRRAASTKLRGSVRQSCLLTLAVLDGRAILQINENPQLIVSIEGESQTTEPSTSPAQLTIRPGGDAKVARLALARDLHYLHPNQTAAPWSIQLDDGEYLMLGDNVPVSIDSRQYGPIPRADLVGSVEVVQ